LREKNIIFRRGVPRVEFWNQLKREEIIESDENSGMYPAGF
jgi:hypothetical protein